MGRPLALDRCVLIALCLLVRSQPPRRGSGTAVCSALALEQSALVGRDLPRWDDAEFSNGD